jgi:thiamine kinase-like enzyme
MTNHSYKFVYRSEPYIVRIPGEGTRRLINRSQEREVYAVVAARGLADQVVYFSDDGVKISRFYDGARNCRPFERSEVEKCMEKLRAMHAMKLCVGHEFDIFRKIEEYESLRQGRPSVYPDYQETKARVLALKPVTDELPQAYGLTHLDAVADNFLFVKDEILLIDWEYAAMGDQHLDIAMFAVYAMYDREWTDWLIGCYFGVVPADGLRLKIYCYIAAAGLLWSNWCEYKSLCGVQFGEYAARQYRYAEEYSRLAAELRQNERRIFCTGLNGP